MSDVQVLTPQGQSRNTRGRAPVYTVLLNDEALEIQVHELSVSCGAGQHDAVTLQAQSTELENTKGMVDSLLSFRFGSSPRVEQFQGYIVGAKEEQMSKGALTFTLSVLGATKAMFDGMPNFWSEKSATNAIRDLVQKNLLGFTGHSHTHLWKVLAQTQESDWQFINRLADSIGYVVFNRYGVVGCYDPAKLFAESGSYTKLISSNTRDVNLDRYLIDFEPMEVSDVVQQNLGTKYGYFTTHNDVQIGTQTGDFRGYLFDPTKVIRDQVEAQVYLDATMTSWNDWKQHAVARIWGDADIYPGMCVNVVTTNRKYLRDKFDGKWMVRSTTQQADRQSYQTLLQLTRPQATPATDNPHRPFWQTDAAGRAKPTLNIYNDATPRVWASSWVDRTLASVM